jgi:tetratricopeptide (TPR) repeat protein
VRYLMNQYDEAIADYNEAIRLRPQYAKTYFNRGSAYRKKGQNEQAIADYQKALELSPDLENVKAKLLELGVRTL